MTVPAQESNLIADLLLRQFRVPSRPGAQMRQPELLAGDGTDILKIAVGHGGFHAASAAGTSIATAGADELRRAAMFHIEQVFFRPDATHYDVLGLRRDAPSATVREHFRLLMQLVHPDRHEPDPRWPDYAARTSAAYRVLKRTDTRRQYDRQLDGACAPVTIRVPASAPTPLVRLRRGNAGAEPPPREWLTGPFGDLLRHHPRTATFCGLISVSAAVLGAVALGERDGTLARDDAARHESAIVTSTPQVDSEAEANMFALAPKAGMPVSLAPARPPAVTPTASHGLAVQQQPQHAGEAALGARVANARSTQGAAVLVGAPAPARSATLEASAQPLRARDPAVAAESKAAPVTLTAPDAAMLAVPAGQTFRPGPPMLAEADADALVATFVAAYETGEVDALAKIFDENAQTNLQRGRAAVCAEYDELFHLSTWRRMSVGALQWTRSGDRAQARGVLTVRIGWRDGREAEQRVAIDMSLIKRDDHTLISRLFHQVRE